MSDAEPESLDEARDCVRRLACMFGMSALPQDALHPSERQPSDPDLCAKRLMTAKAWVRASFLRSKHLSAALFADPAWDILLDLYINRLEARRVSVTSSCVAANVPPTTALRWIAVLTKGGWISRSKDGNDGRRYFVDMPDTVAASMDALMDEVIDSDRKIGLERMTVTGTH